MTKKRPILHLSLYSRELYVCKISSGVTTFHRWMDHFFLVMVNWHSKIIFMEMWLQISHSLFGDIHVETHSSICTDESSSVLCVSLHQQEINSFSTMSPYLFRILSETMCVSVQQLIQECMLSVQEQSTLSCSIKRPDVQVCPEIHGKPDTERVVKCSAVCMCCAPHFMD